MKLRVVVLTALVLSICCAAVAVEHINQRAGLRRAGRDLVDSDAPAPAEDVERVPFVPRSHPFLAEAVRSDVVALTDSVLEDKDSFELERRRARAERDRHRARRAELVSDKEGLRRAVRALAGSDAKARADAIEVINSIPRPAHPLLDDEPELLEWKALQDAAVAEFESLLDALNSRDSEIASEAASLIGGLGPKGKAAVPVLIRFLENEATRAEHWQSAVEALAPVLPRDRALGPIVLPILKKTQFPMDGKNPGGEPLVLGLANADHQNIAITATACAQMLIESDRTLIELPHLIEATSREYPRYVRLCALAVLPQFGAEASSAVASLEKLLSDDDVAIRAFAVIASAQIDGNAKQARLRLKESKLEGEDARLVQESVDGWFEQLNQLSRIPEPEPPEGIEEGGMPFELEIYLDQAKSPHGFHRRAAIREIAKMGRAAKPALPALRDLLKHSEEATRQLAADAIRKIESDR